MTTSAGRVLRSPKMRFHRDLGDLDLDRRGAVDLVVAGGKADLVGAEVLAQLAVLLFGERPQRRGVDRGLAQLEGLVDGRLGHERLARAGRHGDHHAVAGKDALERLLLNRVGLDVLGEEEALVESQLDLVDRGHGTRRSAGPIRWFINRGQSLSTVSYPPAPRAHTPLAAPRGAP